MSDKIKPHHLERKAILYIRQSSAYQVSHNLESQRLQYAMQERLQQLGWREIEVVDEDLGRSAARDGHACGIRTHGGGSVSRQGGSRGGSGGVSLCAQQPGVALVGKTRGGSLQLKSDSGVVLKPCKR